MTQRRIDLGTVLEKTALITSLPLIDVLKMRISARKIVVKDMKGLAALLENES